MKSSYYYKLKVTFAKALHTDTISTTFFSGIGRAVGFLIPFFIARWFGATSDTDAFFFGYSIIIFLATIFSPVVESIIVPYIIEEKINQNDVGAFVGSIFTISAFIMSLLVILIIILSKSLIRVTTYFDNNSINLIGLILIEASPLLILIVWSSIIAGSLNAYRAFKAPALSPSVRALVTISIIYTCKTKLGVHSIAIGYVVGEIARLLALLYVLSKLRLYKIRFAVKFHKNIKSFLITSSFQIAGMSILAFVPIVNKAMASRLGPGNISILEYSDRIYMIPVALMSTGYLVTLLSHASDHYNRLGLPALSKDIYKAVRVVTFAGLSISLFLYILKEPIVSLVYSGAMDRNKLMSVTTMLNFYFVAITPYLLTQVYVRAFIIMRKTSVLFYMALFFSLGIFLLNNILIPIYGLNGIALAYMIQSILALLVLSITFYYISKIKIKSTHPDNQAAFDLE